jgi:MFS family permease
VTAQINVDVEPDVRVTARWLAAFAAAWLGIWMAQLTPIQLLLPDQVDDVLHRSDTSAGWIDSVVAFGIISGIAGVCALVAYPLAGAASDRTTSRYGRRRPWIVIGTLVFAVGLVLLGAQHTIVGVGVWWSVTLVGFCIATAVITATISDQVPVDQRGLVSGLVSAPQAVGIILGLTFVTALALSTFVGYLSMAVALVVLVLPFVRMLPDAVLDPADRPVLSTRAVVGSLWVSPREHPDFGWTLLGRVLVNLGNALGTTLLLYFLEYGLHRSDADDDLLVLTLIYMVFVISASILLGRLSDRIGRRLPFVVASAVIQGVAALVLALVPAYPAALAAAGLLGLGYGCFLSVDQALATQVLPDPASRGKDLGIMNIATAVPQALGPLVGAGLVAAFDGFTALFLFAAVAGLAGAWATSRVRSVR